MFNKDAAREVSNNTTSVVTKTPKEIKRIRPDSSGSNPPNSNEKQLNSGPCTNG